MADLRFPGRSDMIGTLSAATKVDVHALIERLKKDIFRGRIRIREFFRDFDPLRSGVITEAKFRTAFAESRLAMSDPELKALAVHFADPTDPKRVRYEPFLDDIDSIFTTSNMESNPFSTTMDFTPTLVRESPLLTPEETAECEAVVARLAHLVKTRQIDIRPIFDDYSKNLNSTLAIDQVTKIQFRNGLSQLKLEVSAEETAVLTKAFAGASDGYVDYIAFCCAVDPALKTFSAREPRSYVEKPLKSGFRKKLYHADGIPDQPGRTPITFDQPLYPVVYPAVAELAPLIDKLQVKAMQHRLRLFDYFIDFDKHGDGTVTQPQFVKQLMLAYDKIGLGLSEGEIDLLLKTYARTMRHGAQHVMWRKFVDDVNKGNEAPRGMEKDPTLGPSYKKAEQRPVTLQPPAREAAVQKLLADLRKRVEVRRVLVKPLFADFGEWSHSVKISDHITRQNMLQSLSRFGVEIEAADAALLFERYDTLGFGTVNFVAFVRDIDPYEAFSGRAQTLHAFPQDPEYGTKPFLAGGYRKDRVVPGPIINVQPGRPPTTNDAPAPVLTLYSAQHPPNLHVLLEKLQRGAWAQRLRVDEVFKDFDRHRDGTITVPQFQQSLVMTWGKHLPLSQAESDLLVRTYAVGKSGVVHVNWKKFVGDVDSIFVMTKLERNPAAQPPPLVAYLPRPKAPLTTDEEDEVAGVLSRFRKRVMDRRMLVKPFFTDAEYNRNSSRVVDHVTKSQFSQCLARLGLEATTQQVELLTRKFDDKGDGFINYVDFCVAVDPEERGSDREALERVEVPLFKKNANFKAPKTAVVQPGRPPLVANVPGLLSQRPDASSLAELMRRLQEKASQFNVPVNDYFVDYDRHNMGAISRPQFRRALNAAFGMHYTNEAPTEAELNLLEEVYARETLDGEYFFSWKEFCKDIKDVVIMPGLEKLPLAQPHPLVPEIGHTRITLSPEKEAKVQKLLGQMKQRFAIRCVYVKAPFHDFALSNNSPIMIDCCTRGQFVQGLARLGVEPSADELELLFDKYNIRGDGSVNYVAFATDVDPTETFSNRERVAPFSPELYKSTLFGGFRKPRVHEELLRQTA